MNDVDTILSWGAGEYARIIGARTAYRAQQVAQIADGAGLMFDSSRMPAVDIAPGCALRSQAMASFLAARMASAREHGTTATLHLNALSLAGMMLAMFDDAEEAAEQIDGRDDLAVQSRVYLREIAAQERGP